MKLLTEEEYLELMLKARGNGKASEGHTAIMNLPMGRALQILKTEWKHKTSPLRMAMRIEKRYGVKYNKHTLADGSGWVVKRVG